MHCLVNLKPIKANVAPNVLQAHIETTIQTLLGKLNETKLLTLPKSSKEYEEAVKKSSGLNGASKSDFFNTFQYDMEPMSKKDGSVHNKTSNLQVSKVNDVLSSTTRKCPTDQIPRT